MYPAIVVHLINVDGCVSAAIAANELPRYLFHPVPLPPPPWPVSDRSDFLSHFLT